MTAAFAPLAMALAGCAAAAGSPLEVREAGSSAHCNTPVEQARVALLPDASAVRQWQAERGVALVDAASVVSAPHALVEMGWRPTGGYAVAVSAHARLRGDEVLLVAEFTGPAPDSLRTQALSSPCVLVQLPPGRYAAVEVRDRSGGVRARAAAGDAPSTGGGPAR